MIAALTGFATNAGVVGLDALIAQTFPTGVRATATGFVIGVGRGGSALAPSRRAAFRGGIRAVGSRIADGSGSAIATLALLALRRGPITA